MLDAVAVISDNGLRHLPKPAANCGARQTPQLEMKFPVIPARGIPPEDGSLVELHQIAPVENT